MARRSGKLCAAVRFRTFLQICLLAVAATAVAGCSFSSEHGEREGQSVEVGEAVYNVQLTRQLSEGNVEDQAYLEGQPDLKPGEVYLGVFLRIENDGEKPYLPPKGMYVKDSEDREYRPTPSESPFALDFNEAIPPGEEAPAPDTAAADGVAGGALVLFKIESESLQSLPLELEVPSSGGQTAAIELDI